MEKSQLSHRERIELCLTGEVPDRIPVALWRHFPGDDQNPDHLAAATVAFQKNYDFDLIKVTPASSFCLKDWGVTDRWIGNTEGTRAYESAVIYHPDNWRKLPVLNPNKGHLAEQIASLRLITHEFGRKVPVLQTIFNPLAQAKHLVADGKLLVLLRQNPEALKEGLEIITHSTIAFIEVSKDCGIDGVLYQRSNAQSGLLSEGEFEEFSRSYDLRILEAANSFWCNMVHVHGEDILFNSVTDYPAAILNWHDRHTSPSLSMAQKSFNGVVCGGLRQWETMALGTTELVIEEAAEAIFQTRGKKFILGTGCVLPVISPHGNILAACQAAALDTGR